MATLYVAEFSGTANVGTPGGGGGLGGQETGTTAIAGTPPIAEQTVAIGASSTQVTNAFGSTTRMVRLHADAICSVAFGASPTAAATNMRLAANQTEYFGVSPGTKVAVITNT